MIYQSQFFFFRIQIIEWEALAYYSYLECYPTDELWSGWRLFWLMHNKKKFSGANLVTGIAGASLCGSNQGSQSTSDVQCQTKPLRNHDLATTIPYYGVLHTVFRVDDARKALATIDNIFWLWRSQNVAYVLNNNIPVGGYSVHWIISWGNQIPLRYNKYLYEYAVDTSDFNTRESTGRLVDAVSLCVIYMIPVNQWGVFFNEKRVWVWLGFC